MQPVPPNWVVVNGVTYSAVEWRASPGVVYLMRCLRTGEYKVGGTIDPYNRFRQLTSQSRCRLGREPTYVWSIITNGVGRLENCWTREWKRYRIDNRREWYFLPDREVARFKSISVVSWKDYPSVSPELREMLTP